MVTEKNISAVINREIKSPIRIGSLTELQINREAFLSYFQPLFENLESDEYLVKENQITFLKNNFSEDIDSISSIHKSYFEKQVGVEVLEPWISRLTIEQKKQFSQISTVTRQRNISRFTIEKVKEGYQIQRVEADSFEQKVNDFRSWKREFKQATEQAVENELFYQLLQKAFELVASIHPEIYKLKITSHFMRTLTKGEVKGENSPEGMHEDGAQYIISALVVNRKNILGGETQIFEKKDEVRELIFNKELELGEFAFQADTGEEKTFGNDLWHYVTPIQPIETTEQGIRDIIGFDIEIIK